MSTKVKVTFSNGECAVVAFGLRDPARIGIVLKAWALLWQRDVMRWERTSEPAEFWYDAKKRHMCRYDDPICHDLLEVLIPLTVAMQHRQKAVEELRRQGHKVREIARQLSMPVPGVSKLLKNSAEELPPL